MNDKEYIICKLVCPKCHTHWANAKFYFDKAFDPKNLTIITGKKKKPKAGDDLTCSICGYIYTNWDVHIAILDEIAYAQKQQSQYKDK